MPAFTMPGSLRGKNDSYWFPVVAFNQYIHYKVWLVKNNRPAEVDHPKNFKHK